MLSRPLIGFLALLSSGVSFSPPSWTTTPRSASARPLTTMFSTTEAPPMKAGSTNFPQYTDEQLKAALDSLLEGSTDRAFDGRHLFGFGDVDHTLSKLQAITATRILDYKAYLVRIVPSFLLCHSFLRSFSLTVPWLGFTGRSFDTLGRILAGKNPRLLEGTWTHS